MLLLAALAAAQIAPEAVLEELRRKARTYEERPPCSVTVTASNSSGEGRETFALRYEREEGRWLSFGEDKGGFNREGPPEDHYGAALGIAFTDPAFERREGETLVFRQETIEKGSIRANGRDLSGNLEARLRVDVTGDDPVIEGYSFNLKKPFRIPMIAKVETFDVVASLREEPGYGPVAERVVNRYAIDAVGGGQRGEAVAEFSDYDCPAITASG